MNIGGFLKHNAVGIFLLTGFLSLGFLILAPIFLAARTSARRSTCQSQLKTIALACLQYQQDHDDKYPPLSDGHSRGWSLTLQKSTPSVRLKFSCPEGYNSNFSPTSDYFLNARLATRQGESVIDPSSTIAFGEGPDNGPSNSHYWELPNDSNNPDSPLQRHNGGGNFSFADGHVKMLSPQSWHHWIEDGSDETGHTETHFKFSPDESATRRRPTSTAVHRKQKI